MINNYFNNKISKEKLEKALRRYLTISFVFWKKKKDGDDINGFFDTVSSFFLNK